ncbi:MAG: YHS domain-containing protein [Dehalococcoidia bacterium]|nr:YHS domain-containing protein [Dehalococcoidia bacterium]
MAVDIVCGKEIPEATINNKVGQVAAGAAEINPEAGTKRYYEGKWYYFCSLACRQKFVATPDELIAKAAEASS